MVERKVTSVDVARRAGVSQSAVSRTFTPGASVSVATREKVLAAAQALGYRPNMLARGLITRTTGLVGVVVGDLGNPYHPILFESLASRLQDRGKRPLLVHVPPQGTADAAVFEVLQYQIDGIILVAGSFAEATARECLAIGTPVVLVGRGIGDEGAEKLVDTVSSDNAGGARLAVEALVAAGHRRIAFIAGRRDTHSNSERHSAFLQALARHGLEPAGEEEGSYSYEGGRAAAQRLLARSPLPEALFCANDLMALGALDALRAAGLDVPGEISVVGFDDIPMAAWPAYELTTLRQDVDGIVTHAVDLLEARLSDHGRTAEQVILDVTLVKRNSARL
ncbi:LacI family DNA-binding transcriptional regulator [Telmatospirillum sp. J64-1]|uniref:LacI family DNA-binding transcriptional regulator n=1 Tax=Telmatospirillum sp. J64-1 TaxID=2502183 RepID=UPI00115E29C1|nr:LacI family DNA-binding transcriptional regulator [Telmatospirillum sp. J64-1]